MKSKRLTASLLAFMMVFTSFGTVAFAETPNTPNKSNTSDVSGHWAENVVEKWTDGGVVNGYEDGTFRPDKGITRAEFIKITNGLFGFKETGTAGFSDVSEGDWYAGEVKKAVYEGFVSGYEDGTFKPNNGITRQEAAMVISSIMDREGTETTALVGFADKANVPDWSRSALTYMVQKGCLSGYQDKTLRPAAGITRAETVTMLDRVAGTVYGQAGVYGPASGSETIDGNVSVTVDGVTIRNTIIKGDLHITAGVGDGEASFESVTVEGETIVNGGGMSTVTFENSDLDGLVITKKDGKVRILIIGDTNIDYTTILSGAMLEQLGLTGDGFGKIVVERVEEGQTVVLDGNFDEIIVNCDAEIIITDNSVVGRMVIAEGAGGASVDIEEGSRIEEFVANAEAEVKGEGQVESAELNVEGIVIEQEVDEIVLGDDVGEAKVGGETVTESTEPETSSGNGRSKVATVNVSAISVTGDVTVGATLTASPTPVMATGIYQWKSADTANGTYTNITGATSSTYLIDSAYAGKYIKVTFTGTVSYSGTLTSDTTGVVFTRVEMLIAALEAMDWTTADQLTVLQGATLAREARLLVDEAPANTQTAFEGRLDAVDLALVARQAALDVETTAAVETAISALESVAWTTAEQAAVTQGVIDAGTVRLLVDEAPANTQVAFDGRLDVVNAALVARQAALDIETTAAAENAIVVLEAMDWTTADQVTVFQGVTLEGQARLLVDAAPSGTRLAFDSRLDGVDLALVARQAALDIETTAAANDAIAILEEVDWTTADQAAVTQGVTDAAAARLLLDAAPVATHADFNDRLDAVDTALTTRQAEFTAFNQMIANFEPNNTSGTAALITIGGIPQSHAVYPAGDEDWVEFSAEAGKYYQIVTSNLMDDPNNVLKKMDTYIELYAAAGATSIEENDDIYYDNDNYDDDLASKITWECVASGTYYVRIMHHTHSADNYPDPDTGTGSYDISINVLVETRSDSFEFDNTSGTAMQINTDGTLQSHSIYQAGDEDWVWFHAEERNDYQIVTSNLMDYPNDAEQEMDTYIELYGADGSTLIYEDDDYDDYEDGDGRASKITWTCGEGEGGTYYVRITHFYDEIGSYDISITASANLDYVAPTLETVKIDDVEVVSENPIVFAPGDTFGTITAQLSESVTLVEGATANVTIAGVEFGTVTASENILTITPTNQNGSKFVEGTFQFDIAAEMLKDVVGNKNEAINFTLTFRVTADMTD